MCKFPAHKYTILRQKGAAALLESCRWPGWLQSDVDFAENGAILSKREVQSEYWVRLNNLTVSNLIAQMSSSQEQIESRSLCA